MRASSLTWPHAIIIFTWHLTAHKTASCAVYLTRRAEARACKRGSVVGARGGVGTRGGVKAVGMRAGVKASRNEGRGEG